MKRFYLYTLYIFIALMTKAQQPMLVNHAVNEYHGGTQNWAIDITPDKRILFANNAGLVEFDSQRWQVYPLKNYSYVRNILFDREKAIVWAGGSDEFGYFTQNIDNNYVEYHSLSDRLPQKDRHFDEVWKILRVGKTVVFQAKYALFMVDVQQRVSTMKTPFAIEASAQVDGRLLLASKQGLYSVKGKTVEPLPHTEALAGKTIRSILPYRDGQLLIATATDGLFVYDGQETRPLLLDITPQLKSYQIFCADIQADILAIGTVRNGLILKDLKTDHTKYANISTGLQNNTVLSLRFDELDNVWLGLDQGTAYVMPGFPYSNMLGPQTTIGTGYASLIHGDKLYLGTNQGLFTISYPIHNSPEPPKPQLVGHLTGQVWTLTRIGNRILCGSDAGAFVVTPTGATPIKGVDGTWKFLPLSGTDGLVLACDYQGLVVLRPTANGYERGWRLDGFSESSGNLFEDSDGSIWISHWHKGIYHLWLSADKKRVTHTVIYNQSNGLLTDDNNQLCSVGGQIYISGVDGFHRLNRKTRRLEHVDRLNHIFNNYGASLAIRETPTHDLWAYKLGYLAIAHRRKDGYDVDTLSYKTICPNLQIGLGDISFMDSLHTIFNGNNGFYVVRNQHTPTDTPSHIILQDIKSTNRTEELLFAMIPDDQNKTYTIDHDNNSIRIGFVMPEYSTSNTNTYCCYLENYDKEWGAWQTTNYKEYTHLPKGNYTLRIKALNRLNGKETETSIKLKVLPAWYETWWAYVVYLVLLGLLLRQAARYAMSRYEHRLTDLQQQKEHELTKLRNEQLETELQHRQSQLADSTMNLMRKNDMLQALDTQMSELSESVRREDPKAGITRKIKDIRHDIQQNINEDEGWAKFEENFNLVYENFMKKLTARFPDLKMNDRKLCAYLRMGLSSKEMASLLNTSVRSIETARYRLRKKLNMEQGDNLAEFIQKF